MKSQKSFTLIELLVVIAMVGLLSSIVVVSLRGTGEKAQIARAQQFSQSIQNRLGAETAGVWRFEEKINGTCPGGKDVCDASGNGNHGVWIGSGSHWVTNNDIPQLGTAGQFNGVNDYVDAGKDQSLNITDAITIEAWVRRADSGLSSNFIVSKGENGAGVGYHLYLTPSNGKVYFVAKPLTGNQYVDSKTLLLTGHWYHLAAVYDGFSLKLYVNGILESSDSNTGKINPGPNFNLNIGKDSSTANWYFSGLIDDVKIYSQGLNAAAIERHYAEGLEKHKLVKQ